MGNILCFAKASLLVYYTPFLLLSITTVLLEFKNLINHDVVLFLGHYVQF